MNKHNQLAEIHNSKRPYIIYKSEKGFDLYTNFSKKFILNNKNVSSFLSQRYKNKSKNTDLFIGFFSYEILCHLLNIKIKNQKKINFYKGIFYKPETVIKIRDKIKIVSSKKEHKFNETFHKTQILTPFQIFNFNCSCVCPIQNLTQN